MATLTPTANHLTLRLKHQRITTLLAADPLSSFETIKSHLITALRSTGRTMLLDQDLDFLELDAIEFGVPIDKWDLTKGWMPLELPEEADDTNGGDEEDDAAGKKGKGRSSSKKQQRVENTTPQGAGLKDGAVLAVRIKGQHWDVDVPSYDDERVEDMDES